MRRFKTTFLKLLTTITINYKYNTFEWSIYVYLRFCLNVYRRSPLSNKRYGRIRKLFCQFFVFDTDNNAVACLPLVMQGWGNEEIFHNFCKDETFWLQSHTVNKDTKRAIESLRFNEGPYKAGSPPSRGQSKSSVIMCPYLAGLSVKWSLTAVQRLSNCLPLVSFDQTLRRKKKKPLQRMTTALCTKSARKNISIISLHCWRTSK